MFPDLEQRISKIDSSLQEVAIEISNTGNYLDQLDTTLISHLSEMESGQSIIHTELMEIKEAFVDFINDDLSRLDKIALPILIANINLEKGKTIDENVLLAFLVAKAFIKASKLHDK
jgi:hypothetical protein